MNLPDLVKGKHSDDGRAICYQPKAGGLRGHHAAEAEKDKRETQGRTQVALWLHVQPFLPFACVPGTSSTMLEFLPVVLRGSRTNGNPFAGSLQLVPFVVPSLQIVSLPLPSGFIPVGLTPRY